MRTTDIRHRLKDRLDAVVTMAEAFPKDVFPENRRIRLESCRLDWIRPTSRVPMLRDVERELKDIVPMDMATKDRLAAVRRQVAFIRTDIIMEMAARADDMLLEIEAMPDRTGTAEAVIALKTLAGVAESWIGTGWDPAQAREHLEPRLSALSSALSAMERESGRSTEDLRGRAAGLHAMFETIA